MASICKHSAEIENGYCMLVSKAFFERYCGFSVIMRVPACVYPPTVTTNRIFLGGVTAIVVTFLFSDRKI
jgi:hypothetical protein